MSQSIRVLGLMAVYNEDAGSSLEAFEINAVAEGGNSVGGLRNEHGAVVLHGGTYVARDGGSSCDGIVNRESGATLHAKNVIGLGENCAGWNVGMMHVYDATAVIQGGEFYGRGGSSGAVGVEAWSGGSIEAYNITARAEDSSYQNLGLFTSSTNVLLANSVLEGSTKWVSASSSPVEIIQSHLIGADGTGSGLSCLAVTHSGTFYESSCP